MSFTHTQAIKRTCYTNIENKIMKMQMSKKKKEHNKIHAKAHATR